MNSLKINNNVHQDKTDGKWYFWNETKDQRLGPYDSEQQANQKLIEYAEWLETEGQLCSPKTNDLQLSQMMT